MALKNWTWDPFADDWDRSYLHLVKYVKRKGTFRVPNAHKEDGVALGWWVIHQRFLHGKGTLSPERTKRLEKLKGWVWSAREAT